MPSIVVEVVVAVGDGFLANVTHFSAALTLHPVTSALFDEDLSAAGTFPHQLF